jgi:6-phosphogluconolactonase (cycloisomerase 2 family)
MNLPPQLVTVVVFLLVVFLCALFGLDADDGHHLISEDYDDSDTPLWFDLAIAVAQASGSALRHHSQHNGSALRHHPPPKPENTTTVVAIGTYTAALHLFTVSPHGIARLGTSTAFGPNQEAMLFVADPRCNTEANLIAIENNCACSSQNGRSLPECCTARGNLVSARVHADGTVMPVDHVAYDQAGPIHMAQHPAEQITVANYIGGTASIYGPMDPRTGRIGSRSAVSRKLANRSVVHMVTSDPRACGSDRRILAVDADYPGIMFIDPFDARLVAVVDMPARIRRLVFHPTLALAYVVYETAGTVGVWSWPRCGAWTRGSRPPAELSHFATMPPGTSDDAINKPTALLLSADGMFAYTCTRTAFFLPTTANTSKIGVFRIGHLGAATPIQWVDTGGYNTRECKLTKHKDQEMLFAVDVVTNKFIVYRRDQHTGLLEQRDVADVPHPTMIEERTFGTQPCPSHAMMAAEAVAKKGTTREGLLAELRASAVALATATVMVAVVSSAARLLGVCATHRPATMMY